MIYLRAKFQMLSSNGSKQKLNVVQALHSAFPCRPYKKVCTIPATHNTHLCLL